MIATVTTSAGPVTVRGLRHREVKQLRLRERAAQPEQAGNIQEEVLQLILSAEDYARLDDMYEYEVLELFNRVIALTFLTEDARKNLSLRQDSTIPTSTVDPAAPPPASNSSWDVPS